MLRAPAAYIRKVEAYASCTCAKRDELIPVEKMSVLELLSCCYCSGVLVY